VHEDSFCLNTWYYFAWVGILLIDGYTKIEPLFLLNKNIEVVRRWHGIMLVPAAPQRGRPSTHWAFARAPRPAAHGRDPASPARS
jgi:hypothetical protein